MLPDVTYDHATEMTAALAEHRRRLEALAAATDAALDNAQSVATANLAAFHHAVAELNERLLHLEASESTQVRAARQVALFKAGLERAIGTMEQLRSLIHQSQATARLVLSQRVRDALDEAQSMAAPSGHDRK